MPALEPHLIEQSTQKKTLLQSILNKVTNLRSESDPRNLFNEEASSYQYEVPNAPRQSNKDDEGAFVIESPRKRLHTKNRSVTPLLMVENNIMANTHKEDQLVSYRRSARSRDSEL
jgi:hypothetical protein